jgi:hypothetical protein
MGVSAALDRPQVAHPKRVWPAVDALALKTQGRKPCRDDVQTARVLGGDRRARDELLGELKGARHRMD